MKKNSWLSLGHFALGVLISLNSLTARAADDETQKTLSRIEMIRTDLGSLQKRSSVDTTGMCKQEIDTYSDQTAKDVANAAIYIGEYEVTSALGNLLQSVSLIQDYCNKDTNSTLRRVPNRSDALVADEQISKQVLTILPLLEKIQAQLVEPSEKQPETSPTTQETTQE